MSCALTNAIAPVPSLSNEHRARLFRSACKLGTILGVKPDLLEREMETQYLRQVGLHGRGSGRGRGLGFGQLDGNNLRRSRSVSIESDDFMSMTTRNDAFDSNLEEEESIHVPMYDDDSECSTPRSSADSFHTPLLSRSLVPSRSVLGSVKKRRAPPPAPLRLHSRATSETITIPVQRSAPLSPISINLLDNQNSRKHHLKSTSRSSLNLKSSATPPPPLSTSITKSNLENESDCDALESPIATPLTASYRFAVPSIPEARTRRLEKLARTLGDNVPEEIVFPGKTDDYVAVTQSEDGMENFAEDARERTVDEEATPTQATRTNTLPIAESSSSIQQSSLLSPRPRSALQRRSRSLSLSLAIDSETSKSLSLDLPERGAPWIAPAEWAQGPSSPSLLKRYSKMKDSILLKRRSRAEEDWKGEWSAQDHTDVMRMLRGLKKRGGLGKW